MTKLRFLLLTLLASSPAASFAQPVDPSLYAGIRWRLIGPFRGGKATMVSGVPGNPALYYMGTAGSRGVEKGGGGAGGACRRGAVRPTGLCALRGCPSPPPPPLV